MTAPSNRTQWTLLIGLCTLMLAGTAAAASNPATCTNDDDCVATPQCGGDVCDWNDSTAGMKCKPAGSYPKLMDGWCTTDDDCKCKDMGATCDGATLRCTFTRPCDAPSAGGCNTGGSSGTGGSTGTGGSGATGTGGTGGGNSDSGGCSVSGGATADWSLLLAGLGLLFASRRRSR
jgi:MYXO-CTERM domain-containing protein